jgi:addiction module HigA family antidote
VTEKGNTAYESTINTEFVLGQKEIISVMSKSLTTTNFKEGDKLPPIHPGSILQTEFMEPCGLSSTKLATYMGTAATRVTAIVRGDRAITADTALRLARVFKVSPEFWLNLQANYDVAMLDYTGEKDKICQEAREFATA